MQPKKCLCCSQQLCSSKSYYLTAHGLHGHLPSLPCEKHCIVQRRLLCLFSTIFSPHYGSDELLIYIGEGQFRNLIPDISNKT